MKSINVYNALIAFKQGKATNVTEKNGVLTVTVDENQFTLPFYLIDEHIKKYEKLAKQESQPIKPPSISVSNKRCLVIQNYYIEAKQMDSKKRKAAIKAFRKVEMPKNSVWFSKEILTPHDKASILELF